MLNRRNFVIASTAASLLPKAALAADKADVIILGGGLSGLNAASILKAQGLRPIVLEANSQVGGRVRTHQTTDGGIDLGASQIGRGYARVIDACARFGVKLVPEDRELLPFGVHFMDTWIDPKTWSSNPLNHCVGSERTIPPHQIGQAVASRHNPLVELDDWLNPKFADQDVSLRTLMRSKGYSDAAIQLARFSAPGVGIDETSMLRTWQEDTRGALDRRIGSAAPPPAAGASQGENRFIATDHKTLINGLAQISNMEGGCQSLPLAMAAQLGDIVRLGKTVVRVDMTDTRATVTCADGSSYEAPFVLSAMPFSVLRQVKIGAVANPIARTAIDTMPYANTARLFLLIEKPFWKEDGLPASFATDGPLGMVWTTENPAGGPYQATIVLTGSQGRAIARRGLGQAEPFLIEELARLRPASRGLVKVLTYKDWTSDPLQRGCGFSLAPGQINGFAREMIKPWQRMHFAGEHTRRLDYGMESAFESSERAALEILDRA